jgi:hypothetical protein
MRRPRLPNLDLEHERVAAVTPAYDSIPPTSLATVEIVLEHAPEAITRSLEVDLKT